MTSAHKKLETKSEIERQSEHNFMKLTSNTPD